MRRGLVTSWLLGLTVLIAAFLALAVVRADDRTQEVVVSSREGADAPPVPSPPVSDDVASFLAEPMAFMDALLHEQAEQTEECLSEAGVSADAIDDRGLVNPDWEVPSTDLDSEQAKDVSPSAVACMEALKSNEDHISEGITLASRVLALGVDQGVAGTSRTDELAAAARSTPSRSGASLYEEVRSYVEG